MEQSDTLKIPKKGASADEIRKFLDRVCDRESSKRREIETELLENKAYIEGYQWLMRHKGDPRRAPRFTQADPQREGIPMPVTNEILGPVDNEVSRLSKRNSETYVDPSDQSPEAKAGAKVANDAMTSHLREIKWSRVRRKGTYHDVLYGTMIIKSFLEQDNLDTVKVGIIGKDGQPVAQRCAGSVTPPSPIDTEAALMMGLEPPGPTRNPPCGCTLASPEFPEDKLNLVPFAAMHQVKIQPTFDFKENKAGSKHTAMGCLSCGGNLEPFVPDLREAHGKDFFGRPLGKDVPKGCAKMVAVNPLCWYPANEGLGQDPETLEWWAEAQPRSVDWVKRYCQKNTNQVKPEGADLVAEVSPILGEYSSEAYGTKGAVTRPIFHDHVRFREFYSVPSMEYPRGRAIAMAGNIVVMDDDLMIDPEPVEGEIPGKPFPRVKLGIARCFTKDGEIWGQGAPVHAKSLQNRINMTNSQVVDTREHNVGGILASRAMKLVREWVRGFAGYVFRYDPDPTPNAPAAPQAFRTGIPDPQAIKEIEYCTDRISAILGTMGVETGGVPAPGVTAASAIQFSAEKAAERRQQREKELIDAFEEVFEHQLRLMQKYYREEDGRTYQIEAAKGWEKKEFWGAQINGETGIKIREQPAYDVKMAERESMWQLIDKGWITPDDPYVIREVGKVMGAPMAILVRDNRQLDDAGRKWFEFLRDGVVPSIDPNLDDHKIHYREFGKYLKSEEGIELAQKADWNTLLSALWGWEEDLAKATEAVAEAKMLGWKPGQPLQMFQQMAYQNKMASYQQGKAQLDMAMQQGATPVEAPPPPQPPTMFPNPAPPPEPLPELIAWVWMGRFMERGVQPTPEGMKFAAFHAVYEAHHALYESEAQAQMAGQVQAPAPGSAPGPMAPAEQAQPAMVQ